MYLSLLPATLLLSLAAAAQTTSSALSVAGASSACAGQPVLESCLASTEAIANACATTDYQCLCQKWGDVLTCFQECPNDARYSSVLSNQQTYCNDASVYSSSTSIPISRAVSSSVTAATTTDTAATTTSDSGSGAVRTATSTSASASATGTSGAGGNLAIGAGQVMLGLAGVVGVFL